MGTGIILIILVIVIILAIRSGSGHFKGEGGCCGGGSDEVHAVEKKLSGEKIGEVILSVEGMRCDNCKNRVANALNAIDGVVADVDLKQKTVDISLERPVSDGKLRSAVENLGYQVTHIEHKEI